MWIAYIFLLVLYGALTLLYAVMPPSPTTLPSWRPLTQWESLSPAVVPCQVDADCESNRICLSHTNPSIVSLKHCTPKLLKGGECTPERGEWKSHSIHETPFAICSCLDPQLFDQNVFGGDCTVSVACGVHGVYDPASKTCHCDPGYTAAGAKGFNILNTLNTLNTLNCQKGSVMEHMAQVPCGPDELEAENRHPFVQTPFHEAYRANLGPTRCVKRPCSFDALSGRPLKHGRYVPEWGCVCDPSYGLFGVQLGPSQSSQSSKDSKASQSSFDYLKAPGFDACASLFLRDPQQPIDVKVVTYFGYYGLKKGDVQKNEIPVSLILFDELKEENLMPLFKGRKGQFMIHQAPWRYDFAQHFFKRNPTFRARVRKLVDLEMFNTTRREDQYRDDFKPKDCHTFLRAKRADSENPVCHISEHDPRVEGFRVEGKLRVSGWKDRVVVNPNQITLTENTGLDRFNAFVLEYDKQMNQWTLDLEWIGSL